MRPGAYQSFSRAEWARLRANTPLTLTEAEVAIAGSVAVGKSTFARVLRALMARWPDHPAVDLVTTDGFLHPLLELQQKQLMSRKGFPESYDTRSMVAAPAAGRHR